MSDLSGAREKLQRAGRHIKDFESGLDAYLRETRERLVHDLEVKKAKFIRDQPIPVELVCIIGDAVHNMRSALDHVACAVAKRNGVTSEKGIRETDFTIRRTKSDFNDAIKKPKVTRIGTSWVRFLERMEPYHEGENGDLLVISELDNLDKHRDLIVLAGLFDTYVHVDGDNYRPVKRGIPVEQGVEVALDPTDPDYHTHHQTRVVIRESIPGLDSDAWTEKLLAQLLKCAVAVIDAAEADATLWS